MFEDYYYPDGTKPEWKAIDTLQRMFMELHRELRLIKPLTFPVSTMALVHDGKEYLDKDYKELCAEEWAKGGSFFCYNSDNPSSLASCCFHKDTKILWKSSTEGVKLTTLEDLHNIKWEPDKKNLKIFHNGSWIMGKSIKLPNRKMFKVTTHNNKEFIMSDNHINVTYSGEKSTENLITEDYLMFNTSVLHGVPEVNENLTYEQGYALGSFLGESSLEDIVSKEDLDLNCLLHSVEFRKGILDGWYNTAGGNSNRSYSTSKNLIEYMEILCSSLGLQTIIDVVNRTDEPVVIRDQEFKRNYPLYCLRWYTEANHRVNKTSNKTWKKKNNSIYWKIKSIEPVDYKDDIYCIQCNNEDEPYFTLPCGLITHNCRVLNEMEDNTFSSTTGMTGIMTGSSNVITLNINRFIQNVSKLHNIQTNWKENTSSIKAELEKLLDRVYKYHIAYKTMLYEQEDKGMFTFSTGGYLYLKKLYSTIGVLGYGEAAKFLGLDISNNTDYKEFLQLILGTIRDQNKAHAIRDSKRPFLFNSEAVPGESLAVKLYQWDKADGYVVPENQNLYNCYFYNPWSNDTSVLDKLKLHGKEISKFTDGGQAAHVNLDAHLSKEQYLKLLDVAKENGSNYFTFNIPMSECADCGHVVNAPIKECPHCHSKHIKYWTRIIG